MAGTHGPIKQNTQPYRLGNYPFTDDSTFTSVTGRFVSPDAFLDARMYPINGGPLQYVSSISYINGQVTITVSDETNVVGTAKTSTLGDSVVPVIDTANREVGVFVIDRPRLISSLVSGETLSFDVDGLALVATCVIPNPSSAVVALADEDDVQVAGEVWLLGEAGVVLETADNVVTVHLVGDPLFVRKACENQTSGFNTSRPLKAITINGGDPIYPDEFGDFKFSIGTGGGGSTENTPIRITPTVNGIVLSMIGRPE